MIIFFLSFLLSLSYISTAMAMETAVKINTDFSDQFKGLILGCAKVVNQVSDILQKDTLPIFEQDFPRVLDEISEKVALVNNQLLKTSISRKNIVINLFEETSKATINFYKSRSSEAEKRKACHYIGMAWFNMGLCAFILSETSAGIDPKDPFKRIPMAVNVYDNYAPDANNIDANVIPSVYNLNNSIQISEAIGNGEIKNKWLEKFIEKPEYKVFKSFFDKRDFEEKNDTISNSEDDNREIQWQPFPSQGNHKDLGLYGLEITDVTVNALYDFGAAVYNYIQSNSQEELNEGSKNNQHPNNENPEGKSEQGVFDQLNTSMQDALNQINETNELITFVNNIHYAFLGEKDLTKVSAVKDYLINIINDNEPMLSKEIYTALIQILQNPIHRNEDKDLFNKLKERLRPEIIGYEVATFIKEKNLAGRDASANVANITTAIIYDMDQTWKKLELQESDHANILATKKDEARQVKELLNELNTTLLKNTNVTSYTRSTLFDQIAAGIHTAEVIEAKLEKSLPARQEAESLKNLINSLNQSGSVGSVDEYYTNLMNIAAVNYNNEEISEEMYTNLIQILENPVYRNDQDKELFNNLKIKLSSALIKYEIEMCLATYDSDKLSYIVRSKVNAVISDIDPQWETLNPEEADDKDSLRIKNNYASEIQTCLNNLHQELSKNTKITGYAESQDCKRIVAGIEKTKAIKIICANEWKKLDDNHRAGSVSNNNAKKWSLGKIALSGSALLLLSAILAFFADKYNWVTLPPVITDMFARMSTSTLSLFARAAA